MTTKMQIKKYKKVVETVVSWIDGLKKSRKRWCDLRTKGDNVCCKYDLSLGYDANYYLKGICKRDGGKTGLIANHIRHFKSQILRVGFCVPKSGYENKIIKMIENDDIIRKLFTKRIPVKVLQKN